MLTTLMGVLSSVRCDSYIGRGSGQIIFFGALHIIKIWLNTLLRSQMIFIGALELDWKVRRLIGTVVSWLCISLNLVDHSAQE